MKYLLFCIFFLPFLVIGMEQNECEKTELALIKFLHSTVNSKYLNNKAHFCEEQLKWAIENNFTMLLQELYKYTATCSKFSINSNTYVKYAFLQASVYGNLPAIKFFIEKGIDIDTTSNTVENTALLCATYRSRHDVVSYLLEKGANTEKSNKALHTALACAILANNSNIVLLLLQGKKCIKKDSWGKPIINNASPNGLPPQKQHATIFNWLCAQKSRTHFIQDFIKVGAILNPKDVHKSPLLDAIKAGNSVALSILLQHKTDPNFKLANGNSPLREAISQGNFELVKQLAIGIPQTKEVLSIVSFWKENNTTLFSLLPQELLERLSHYFYFGMKSRYIKNSLRYAKKLIKFETDETKKQNLEQIILFLKEYQPSKIILKAFDDFINKEGNRK